MNDIKRKIYSKLDKWISSPSKTAALITGARQVGKTYSIRKFASSHFKNFLEINFYTQPEYISLFSNISNVNDCLLRLSGLVSNQLVKGETLIFFDEVQLCPSIVTYIKFLVDEGSYSYILSGSLLGVALNNIASFPVGYLSIFEMYPLDFEEFLLANGVQQELIDYLEDCYKNKKSVKPYFHKTIMNLHKLYLFVGGMPAAVNTYLETHDLVELAKTQSNIISLYKKDISQYNEKRSDKLSVMEIFDLIPSELNNENKRFILKNLNEKSRLVRYEDNFLWLKDAGVALPTYNVEEPRYPLLLSKTRNLFKLFSSDVGLLSSLYANKIALKLLNDELTINYGAISENYVAQELAAHGFPLYYYNSKKNGELDFIIELEDTVFPIEVKSGKDYKRHKALHNVLVDKENNIKNAVVLCNDNEISTDGVITNYPIYMTMFIKEEELDHLYYKVNIDELNKYKIPKIK